MSRPSEDVAGRRLLLLNWRDLDHPRAGGAEVYCVQVAERLASRGAEVTLFTARHPGAPRVEHRGGVTVLRRGGTLGVYALAAQHLGLRRRAYDAVIDFQNGIPFFSPLFTGRRTAVVCVIHHVHQEQFALHYPGVASRVGQLLEGPVSRAVYGHRPLVAVSPSTRRDVRRRLHLRGPIHVVPNGVLRDADPPPRHRTAAPSIAVVSRLVSHKRFDLLLDALPLLRQRWPDLRVDIAGDGPARTALEQRAEVLGLGGLVRFHGFVPAAQRRELLASAWLTVSPSQAEGWGLTVLEAGAEGVPAVAFAVPGLRDSILDGRTGWLVPEGGALSEGVDRALRALSDPEVAAAFSERCRAWSRRFSWDASTERLARIVAAEISRVERRGSTRRRSSDLAVRVDAVLDPAAEGGPAVPEAVRRSDQWSLRGRDLHLLLHDCDELGAEQVLRRLPVQRVRGVALATGSDLLMGALGDSAHDG